MFPVDFQHRFISWQFATFLKVKVLEALDQLYVNVTG